MPTGAHRDDPVRSFLRFIGLTIALLGATCVTAAAQSACLTFPDASFYEVGHDPFLVITEDLDGDADVDLAIANDGTSTGSLSVLLNDGDATFAGSDTYPVAGGHVTSMAVGDLDGDGDRDVVLAHTYLQAYVSVLLNEGDGTFADDDIYTVGGGTGVVDIRDVDDDGHPDLVALTASSGVSILIGNGDGTFADAVTYPAGDGGTAMQVLDLDGDADPDVAVSATGASDDAGPDEVSVLLNAGDGTYAPAVAYPVGNRPGPMAAGDLDGDGDADLVVANAGAPDDPDADDATVLLNAGDGTFVVSATYDVGDDPVSMVMGDLDGDADLDVAITNASTADVTVLLNLGDGSFGPSATLPVSAKPVSSGIEDLDGDGDLDLTVSSALADGAEPSAPNVAVLLNEGNGSFRAAVTYDAGSRQGLRDQPAFAAPGDLDGDGDLDLAVATWRTPAGGITGIVSVLMNTGDGTFGSPMIAASGDEPGDMTAADLDGDGDLDLAAANHGSNDVTVFLDEGDRAFSVGGAYDCGNEPTSVASGDFDGDGAVDLAVADPGYQYIHTLINAGDGSFSKDEAYHVAGSPGFVTCGDLDGDDAVDLIVGNGNYTDIFVLYNTGDGSFAEPVFYLVDGRADWIAVGDLDGDADPDMVAVHRLSGSVSVLFNEGEGSFDGLATYVASGSPGSVAIGDLDGDGDNDLVVAEWNGSIGDVWVLLNAGDGTFTTDDTYETEGLPVALTLGDLDADGDRDLAVAHAGSGISLWLNDGDGHFGGGTTFELHGPSSMAMRDFDGDQLPDLAVTNPSIDRISIFYDQCDDATPIDPDPTTSPVIDATRPILVGRPNPFSSSTTLAFSVPVGGRGTLEVFDATGRLTMTRNLGWLTAGVHDVALGTRTPPGRLASGVWFARLRTAAGSSAPLKLVKLD